MCECKIDTAPCAENTTEFEDWGMDGLRKAEEMLEDKTKDTANE